MTTAAVLKQDLDLDAWRRREGLTWERLAEAIEVQGAAMARRYALGERWPDPETLDRIEAVSHGDVTVLAMHLRRKAWMKQRGGPRRIREKRF